MAYSCKAISKNSFVAFVTEEVDAANATQSPPARSRSLETVRSRPEAEELHEKTEQSLQRLTSVLNSSMLQPSPVASRAQSPESRAAQTSSPATTPKNSYGLRPPGNFSRSLHHVRVSSDCSLSTMAPDDASEPRGSLKAFGSSGSISSMVSWADSSPLKPVGSSGSISSMVSCRGSLRPVGSSNSISSMVSWADLTEDEEVEFDIDIEAGAEAARQEATVELPALSHGRVTEAMTHGLVPKNQNMTEMYKSTKDEPPTTLMIRNIPGKYSQNHLMTDLNYAGFADTYDFLYMPIDKGTSNSVGYAFVNFVDATVAAKCMQCFQGHRFTQLQRSSNKNARISVAHLQGLEKNLQHYEKSAVNSAKQQQRRPVIMNCPVY